MATDKGGAAVQAGDEVTIRARVVAVNPGADGQNLTLETVERTPIDGNTSRVSLHSRQVARVDPGSVVHPSTDLPARHDFAATESAETATFRRQAANAGGLVATGDGPHAATDIGDSVGESAAERKRREDAEAGFAHGEEPKDTRTAAEKKASARAARER